MIVATAGHIDHGKTTLVRALTGVDTDRLPEEKARGISIDIGFAHAVVGATEVAFVDVPGHERFIRNMLAGVCAIDRALVVVAADDGVMPQTVEHVQILHLLGVRQALVAITKADRVPAQRVDAVAAEVHALLAPTTLHGAPALAVSALTGQGLPPLRAHLEQWAGEFRLAACEHEHFRLAVDRAFSVAGAGTIVTGTVFSGSVGVDDHLLLSPRGIETRVRAVQVHGQRQPRAQRGQRCALNLVGVSTQDVARGDWLVHRALSAPSLRCEVRLRVLPGQARALTHWTPVHVHVGTADIGARVVLPRSGQIAPGDGGWAQLVLERPVDLLHGDRFILRDASAQHTVGGGVVLDPAAPPRRRRRAAVREAELRALEQPTPHEILAGLLGASEEGVDLDRFARHLNLAPARQLEVERAADTVVLAKAPRIGVSRAHWELVRARVMQTLRRFHADHPRCDGMDADALRGVTAAALPRAAFQHLLRELANRKAVVLSHDVARLPDHVATANDVDEALWRTVRPALERAAFHAPTVPDLARQLGMSEGVLRDFMHRKARTGEILRVAGERFYLRPTLATLAAIAHEVARQAEGGAFSAAQYRDAIGTGRGVAIELLEFFDALGITQRMRNERRMGRDFVPSLGEAPPRVQEGLQPA